MNMNRAYILDCAVDQVGQEKALQAAVGLIERRRNSRVITLNVEMVYQARNSPELKNMLAEAELVVPDGIGIVWAGRRQGLDLPERVAGIDLMTSLCQEAARRSWRVFLLGAAPGVAERAARNLQRQYPGLQIAGVRDGYFAPEDEDRLVREIRDLSPDLLLAGLGVPKQEFFLARHGVEMGVPLSMGVGGSFDVLSGNKQRAPRWIIGLHLEWLYRLLQEPSRLKRQMVLPRFAWMVLRQRRRKPGLKE